jgi:hypothetical protein
LVIIFLGFDFLGILAGTRARAVGQASGNLGLESNIFHLNKILVINNPKSSSQTF